ncbi:MAG: class D sortase [Oscillospiraceae bacterium]|nr:class D sortase [Oscillospiraceae bacterium]
MRWKVNLCAAVLLTAVLITPASALEYTISSPRSGDFGVATSNKTVYVGTENTVNTDRSKNVALIPPGFGTPSSYLPGSGELLTPNLTGNGGVISAIASGTVIYPTVTIAPSTNYPVAACTAVTDDLYYGGGHLGTLKIPALGVSVKVYQGTDTATLAKGAGHFPESSIWDGNVCVAGHNRGINCYFGEIHTLSLGDRITLTTKLGTRTYAVTSVEKVSETDSSMLAATAGNCITLYTCVRDQSAYRWCVRAVEV